MISCYACNEKAVNHFYGYEKAFLVLLECSKNQQKVFLENNDCVALEKLFSLNFEEAIIQNHCISLYLANGQLVMLQCYPHVILTNQIEHNPLFDFLRRYHRNWCCVEDSSQVHWFCSCNFE